MKYKLSDICDLVKDKIDINLLNETNYVSTENMLANKEGIIPASSLPLARQTQRYCRGDVLVSNIRPYFKKIWYATQDGGCSSDVLVFRAKKDISGRYLYYILSDDKFFEYSMATSKGTKMPRGDKNALMKYDIPYFEYDTQTKIANVLGMLDSKILLNRKINDNLEQQADALFRKFFIDKTELPKGWKKASLLDVANYLNGLPMQKYRPINGEESLPVLKIKELRQKMCDNSSEVCTPNIKPEYIVSNGDVIFSWSGSLLVDFWCGGDCGLNQHLFKVTSAEYDKWFYYSWTKHHLNKFIALASAMATTMGHIKRSELANSEVFIPNENDYKYIGDILSPIYDMIISNRIESTRLSNLRDELLPNLMNGEIDVIAIDI